MPRGPNRVHAALVALLVSACQQGADAAADVPQTRVEGLSDRPLPVGGGEGYADVSSDHDALVSTRAELEAALAAASPGDVVYVVDDARVDLTGRFRLQIPVGVTLASGRGRGSLGGLLFTRSQERKPLLIAGGPGVRITGLRIQGPTTEIDGPDCGGHDAVGIEVSARTLTDLPVEVDNCELWGWPQAAVSAHSVRGVHVHHNHIHHNRREERTAGCRAYGLGYGVVMDRGDVLIEANLFNHNRHDIAGTGLPGTRYEAFGNLSVEGRISHGFDMHGCPDRPEHPDCQVDPNLSGAWISIHDNSFRQVDQYAVVIRGVPEVGAFIDDNTFVHATRDQAIYQRYAEGHLFVGDNAFGWQPPRAWFISYGGETSWKYHAAQGGTPSEVLVGDFDGDGSDDLLRSLSGRWQVSRHARGDWEAWNVSARTPASLRVGDFDGDGADDLLTSDAGHWLVSWGGRSAWQVLNTSSATVSELAFADFDGDGKTDVFRSLDGAWYVSWSGSSRWERVNTSSVGVSSLRVGDVDGDGLADVLYDTGKEWLVSKAARGRWQVLATTPISLSSVGLADFDGEGRIDALRTVDGQWQISRGAAGPWERLMTSGYELSALVLGDFNGDRHADIITLR